MPLRVLIVEDEPVIVLDLTDLLEEAGHKVVGHAAGKADALKLVGATRPDVVIMDMELADGSSGLDVAAAIGASHGTPILFLTGRSDFMVRAMALHIEPLAFVTKPYKSDDVLRPLADVA